MTITTAPETLSLLDTREGCIQIATTATENYRECMLMVVEAWVKGNYGHLNELAEAVGKSLRRMQEFQTELRKAGRLPASNFARSKPGRPRPSAAAVENSGSDGEVIDVDVSNEESKTPNETMPTQEEPKTKNPKRPEHLVKMLNAQGKYIDKRLLPIAEKITELLAEIEVETNRLGGAWEKDNLVFSTSFQECVEHWNECERFDQFGETMNDPGIKTYAEVLEKIRLRLVRASQKMETIQYATGCTEDPNKRELRLVS